MFIGEYAHSLDEKGRVIIPAKFRDRLRGAVMTKGPDGCLCIYPSEEWERVASEARERSRAGARERQTARSFFAGATEAEPDKQGRVALPPPLRDFAGLDREVVVAGVFSRVEIWDRERWRARNSEGDSSLAGGDELPDFGI
jgi:MraZ protein